MEEGRGTQHRHQGDAPRPYSPTLDRKCRGRRCWQYQWARRSLRLLIYKWGIWGSQGPLVEVVPQTFFTLWPLRPQSTCPHLPPCSEHLVVSSCWIRPPTPAPDVQSELRNCFNGPACAHFRQGISEDQLTPAAPGLPTEMELETPHPSLSLDSLWASPARTSRNPPRSAGCPALSEPLDQGGKASVHPQNWPPLTDQQHRAPPLQPPGPEPYCPGLAQGRWSASPRPGLRRPGEGRRASRTLDTLQPGCAPFTGVGSRRVETALLPEMAGRVPRTWESSTSPCRPHGLWQLFGCSVCPSVKWTKILAGRIN